MSKSGGKSGAGPLVSELVAMAARWKNACDSHTAMGNQALADGQEYIAGRGHGLGDGESACSKELLALLERHGYRG